MKKIIFTFWGFMLAVSLNAQDLSVIMKTSRLMGDSVKLSIVAGGTNQVLVDWGDKINIPYTVSGNVNTPTIIHKPIAADSAVIRVLVNGSAITFLTCDGNDLITLDITRGNGLKYLRCFNNKLTEINPSSHTGLLLLYAYNNKLTSLDVTSNAALTDLQVHNNDIGSLNLTGLTALKTLVTTNNPLAGLDVSTNTALQTLNVRNSNLSMLDVSKNTALTKIDVFNSNATTVSRENHFDACQLDALFASLPTKTVAANILISNSLYVPAEGQKDNDAAGSNKTLATAKGWTVKDYQNNILTGNGGVCTTGISNPRQEPQFDIYPNPVVNFMTIRFADNENKHLMRITDIAGKTCVEQIIIGDEVILEFNNLARGIYFVHIGGAIRKISVE